MKSEVTFSGEFFKVCLKQRGLVDTHIVVCLYHKDEEGDLPSSASFSSFYLPEVLELYRQALDYIKENGIPDVFGPDGKKWGWKFQPKP